MICRTDGQMPSAVDVGPGVDAAAFAARPYSRRPSGVAHLRCGGAGLPAPARIAQPPHQASGSIFESTCVGVSPLR